MISAVGSSTAASKARLRAVMAAAGAQEGPTLGASDILISAQWLRDHLEDVVVIDASWFLPSMGVPLQRRSCRDDSTS